MQKDIECVRKKEKKKYGGLTTKEEIKRYSLEISLIVFFKIRAKRSRKKERATQLKRGREKIKRKRKKERKADC